MVAGIVVLLEMSALITGEVKDNGKPLPGVEVSILNFNRTTATNNEGRFTFSDVPVGNYILQFSYFGYEPFRLSVFVNDPAETIRLTIDDTTTGVEKRLMQIPRIDPYLLLKKYGFVIVPSNKLDILDIYKEIQDNNEPMLLTTDLIFHSTHLFFDYLLRIIESFHLYPLLDTLSKVMVKEMQGMYNRFTVDSQLRRASLKNMAFFAVAAKLLDPEYSVPVEVKDIVQKEITILNCASSLSTSPIFGYKVDYTMFKVRGHYAVNQKLRRYFKAMMWLGVSKFILENGEDLSLLQVALIVKALNEREKIRKIWEKIFNIITMFIGPTDDVNFYQILPIMKSYFGENIELEWVDFKKKAHRLREEIGSIQASRILSTPFSFREPLNFRFQGQRFILDSYIFQKLVFPSVKSYLGGKDVFTCGVVENVKTRTIPRALDVFLVLGSRVAEEILIEEGDTEYEQFWEMVKFLKDRLSKVEFCSFYERFLLLMKLYLDENYKSVPTFMTKKTWELKKLNSVLGFWTELRHDILLYAKMSSTGYGLKVPQLPLSYVEPYPQLYKNLRHEILRIETILAENGLLLPGIEANFQKFNTVLNKIETIAKSELKGHIPTIAEQKFIRSAPQMLFSATKFPERYLRLVRSGKKEKMPLIVDVHSDYASGCVLEEGVGYPDYIFAKLSIQGKEVILKGGVFSYYEFKQSLQSRLTDDEWLAMLNSKPPPRPTWIKKLLTTIPPRIR